MSANTSASEAPSIDRIAEINIANGWEPKKYRIVPSNRGYAVQIFEIGETGNPKWIEVCWSRDKADANRMLARRTGQRSEAVRP